MTDTTVRASIVMSPPLLRSPLAPLHASLDATIGVEGGAEFVRSYTDPESERVALTKRVGIADVTVRAKIDVRGDVAAALHATDDAGLAIADDWTLLLLPPGRVVERVAEMQAAAGQKAMVTDVTHLYAGFAIAGPTWADAVERLTSWDPSTLAAGEATGAPIADIRAVAVRRETEVPVLEIFVATEFAGYAWRSILEVVEGLGGGPVGWDALREQGWN